MTVNAVTPAGIGFENTGFSTLFASLSKNFIGNFLPFHSIFSKFSTTSEPLPTSTTRTLSSLKYFFETRCTSSAVTLSILAI